MRTMLKRALENDSSDVVSVVMKGPLSENFTQALNLAYAKADPETGVAGVAVPSEGGEAPTVAAAGTDPVALESAAQDVVVMQKLLSQVVPKEETLTTDNFMTVYGVHQDNVTETEIVEVTQMLAAATNPENYTLIIDATLPGNNGDQSSAPTERFINLGPSLESIAAAYGVKVYSSLQEFARSIN